MGMKQKVLYLELKIGGFKKCIFFKSILHIQVFLCIFNAYFPTNFHRWLTLMLSQEFALPDVLRIWDSLLADETRSDFLIDVCTAMVLVIREDILTNDFADNVKLLQVKFYSFAITFSKKTLPFFFVFKTGDP